MTTVHQLVIFVYEESLIVDTHLANLEMTYFLTNVHSYCHF